VNFSHDYVTYGARGGVVIEALALQTIRSLVRFPEGVTGYLHRNSSSGRTLSLGGRLSL
jgi:hypothetical protein